MAQTIKLKRSSTEGKVPATGNLALGELAINTYDGRVFFKKNDGSDSIEHIVTTDSITTGSVTIQGSLVVDDITINGSTISDSSHFSIAVGGDITLDADGADVLLKDGGTEYGRFKRDNSNFIIKSSTNDKDIIFRGVDNSVTIDALTLDMSNGGSATFRDDIDLGGKITQTGTGENTLGGGIKLANDAKIRWTSDDVYIAGTTSGDNIDFVVGAGSRFNISQTDIDMKIPVNVDDSTQSTSKTTGCMIIDGGVGIAKTLNVGEDVVAYASSDERYKDNVTPIENPNEKLKQIGGYTFDWNDKHEVFKGQHDVGVIAQEIEKVLPEIVETRESGYKAVKYEKIVALLIESNKELLKRVEELESKIK